MAYVIAELGKITSLVEFNHKNEERLSFQMDDVSVQMKNELVTLNVDGTKKKIKMFDLMKALKDTLDSGEFWLDQIDDIVSKIEADREELRETLEAITNPEEYYGWIILHGRAARIRIPRMVNWE